MKFKDIKRFTGFPNYRVNIAWSYLEDHLYHSCIEETGTARLDLNPDFQRGHVWNTNQYISYVEFKLRGGSGADVILLNCVGWMSDFRGPYVLVDGKQRIEAVQKFLRNEISAFGYYYKDYEDKLHATDPDFIFAVNNLKTKKEVLQWYLEINTGGVVHTKEELDKVRELLKNEESKM
jgi:hypothetical protein